MMPRLRQRSRLLPGFNISGNLGAGVSFREKPQIRYFLGLGFLFGKDNRVALNAGGIFGNISELSDQYVKDGNGTYKSLSIEEAGSDPALKKHFVARPFISLTYNLSFLKSRSDQSQTVKADAGSGAGTGAKD